MNDMAIKIIMNYIRSIDPAHQQKLSKTELEQSSYYACAVYEILQVVMDNPLTSALDLVDDFRFTMWYYSHFNQRTNHIFLIAMDAAEEVSILLS